MVALDIARERRVRLDQIDADSEGAYPALREVLEKASPSLCTAGARAYAYAAALEYRHPGLNKNAYLSHPCRVATLYLRYAETPDPAGLATALVHNAYEVSEARPDDLAAALGRVVAEAVGTLTIDRSRQGDHHYLADYYGTIASAPSFVGALKVLDKLDNLYLLCLNPSDERRQHYLQEVCRFVVPLCDRCVPRAKVRLLALVADNEARGHQPANAGRGREACG